jgi:hypothetical protein
MKLLYKNTTLIINNQHITEYDFLKANKYTTEMKMFAYIDTMNFIQNKVPIDNKFDFDNLLYLYNEFLKIVGHTQYCDTKINPTDLSEIFKNFGSVPSKTLLAAIEHLFNKNYIDLMYDLYIISCLNETFCYSSCFGKKIYSLKEIVGTIDSMNENDKIMTVYNAKHGRLFDIKDKVEKLLLISD